jgi:hypothetical protein
VVDGAPELGLTFAEVSNAVVRFGLLDIPDEAARLATIAGASSAASEAGRRGNGT